MDLGVRVLGIYFVLSIIVLMITAMIRGGIQHKRTEPEGNGLLERFFQRVNHPKNRGFKKFFPTLLQIEDEPLLSEKDIKLWNKTTIISYVTTGSLLVVFLIVKLV